MRRFFSAKFALIAFSIVFTSAFTWNIIAGATALGHGLTAPSAVRIAHGPSMPPDPWDAVRIAA